MKRELDELIVEIDEDSIAKIVENWTWLIGTNKTPLLISAIGDMFLVDPDQKVYWLDVGGGELRLAADTIKDFEEKLKDSKQLDEWFMIDLTSKLRKSWKLKRGQLYSYRKLPIIGGDYAVENFAPLDIVEHFGYTGEVHNQIKDLPDGTGVSIKFV